MNSQKSINIRKILPYLLIGAVLPVFVAVSYMLFSGRYYNLISLMCAFIACVPFFIGIEKAEHSARELVTVSVMSGISVVSRLIFAPLPGFKPVSAIIILSGIAFGALPGFAVGSLTAIISNMFYGQGPWTPFQMIMWGLIGFISGLIFKRGKKPKILLLSLYGIFAGVIFSFGMDIFTVLSTDGAFTISRYLFFVASAVPVTVCYALSNVIFLIILTKPILSKTERMRVKYGVFSNKNNGLYKRVLK